MRGPLNYEVGEDTTGGRKKINDAIAAGYGGIFLYNHFDKRQGMIFGTYALPFIERSNVPLVIPVDIRQYKAFEPALHLVEWFSSGKTYPLMIQDTPRVGEFKDLPQGLGKDKYLEGACECIKVGGVVATSLVGGRKTSLPYPPVPVLSQLLAYLHERGVDNWAVHFVGMSPLKEVEPSDYERLKGWNLRTRLLIQPGNTYYYDELMNQFDFSSKESLMPIDSWGYGELAGVVQPSYRGGWPVNIK